MRRGSFDSQRHIYESPIRPYESPRTYESPKTYESPIRPYESPRSYESPRTYESPRSYESPSRYDRPRSLYDSPKVYESVKPYESPRYGHESPKYGYESPKSTYDSPRFRFDSPSLQYDRPRTSYEPPRRYSISVDRIDRKDIVPLTLKVPKIPYDRPSLRDKRDDSVRLQWLPAPVYELPDDARRVSYVIESREVPNQSWTKLATGVPSTSYIAKHLRPDKHYEFRVRAQNQHGISEPTWNASLERRFG